MDPLGEASRVQVGLEFCGPGFMGLGSLLGVTAIAGYLFDPRGLKA